MKMCERAVPSTFVIQCSVFDIQKELQLRLIVKKQKQYRILISSEELVELKRHAYNIPECPGLDKRIQKCRRDKSFQLTFDELEWLVSVLDAVLTDIEGYPCIEHNPWKLEYVPSSDQRCKTCKQLYDRLSEEEDRIGELMADGTVVNIHLFFQANASEAISRKS